MTGSGLHAIIEWNASGEKCPSAVEESTLGQFNEDGITSRDIQARATV